MSHHRFGHFDPDTYLVHYDLNGDMRFPLCGDLDASRSAANSGLTQWGHLTTCQKCFKRLPDINFWKMYYSKADLTAEDTAEAIRRNRRDRV